jgi:hypothetical protein
MKAPTCYIRKYEKTSNAIYYRLNLHKTNDQGWEDDRKDL